MTSKWKGTVAELKAMTCFLEAGINVFQPAMENTGTDLVIDFNNALYRVQVKSSRSYVHPNPPKKSKDEHHVYNFWFNNFLNRYQPNAADIYLLFGLYPIYDTKSNIKSKKKFWKSIILAFTDSEMRELLEKVRTKKENKPDRFFGISFNDPRIIIGKRGFPEKLELTEHLLENKIDGLLNRLKQKTYVVGGREQQ